jgi:hypothetical protein
VRLTSSTIGKAGEQILGSSHFHTVKKQPNPKISSVNQELANDFNVYNQGSNVKSQRNNMAYHSKDSFQGPYQLVGVNNSGVRTGDDSVVNLGQSFANPPPSQDNTKSRLGNNQNIFRSP